MIEIAIRKLSHAHQYEWRSSAPASKKRRDATSRSLPTMATATAKCRLQFAQKPAVTISFLTIGPSPHLAPGVDPWDRSSHPL
jgi:hypothetical protein